MTFDLGQLLMTALTNTISGLITNIVYILLFIWAVRFLGKEIKELGKEIPHWISQYNKVITEQRRISWAKGERK